VVRDQWQKSGDGAMAATATYFRNMQVQHDPARTKQLALLDARVRRALVHGLNREAIAEIVTAGASPATDAMAPPTDPLYNRVQQAIAKYPFDRTRALALLQEAGWTKRGDSLVDASGQQFATEIWTSQVSDNETEMSLVAADWSALGIQTAQSTIPIARNSDREFRANFPGLNITATSISIPEAMRDFTSSACPRTENRFAGSNRGCWSNPTFESLFRTATTTLNDQERDNTIVQAFKVLTDEVGVIGMSYNMEIIPVRKGLVGPAPRWPAQPGNTWNIYDWRWDSSAARPANS
jgi:peptide/nickel transport system substrate-binding protein